MVYTPVVHKYTLRIFSACVYSLSHSSMWGNLVYNYTYIIRCMGMGRILWRKVPQILVILVLVAIGSINHLSIRVY